jgi:hypothetical protein
VEVRPLCGQIKISIDFSRVLSVPGGYYPADPPVKVMPRTGGSAYLASIIFA